MKRIFVVSSSSSMNVNILCVGGMFGWCECEVWRLYVLPAISSDSIVPYFSIHHGWCRVPRNQFIQNERNALYAKSLRIANSSISLSLSFILLLYSLVISLVFLLAHSLSLSLCSISIEAIHTHQKFFMTSMENIVKLQLKTATNIIAVDAKRFVFFSGCCVVFERNFEQYAQPTISMHSFVYSKMCAS